MSLRDGRPELPMTGQWPAERRLFRRNRPALDEPARRALRALSIGLAILAAACAGAAGALHFAAPECGRITAPEART